MTIDKHKLEKLRPEERIRKLRLMEEEKKKEVGEIERLIQQSMQELRIGKIAEEVAPEQRPVDISRLFETTSEQSLERTAKQESSPVAFMKGTKEYQAIEVTNQAYSQLKEIYTTRGAGMTQEQIAGLLGSIGERLNRVEKYMTEGEKAASKLDATKIFFYKIRKEIGID